MTARMTRKKNDLQMVSAYFLTRDDIKLKPSFKFSSTVNHHFRQSNKLNRNKVPPFKF